VILLGLGGNIDSALGGPPMQTLIAALVELSKRHVNAVSTPYWWSSPPDPPSEQPWYTNSVVEIETELPPEQLLKVLLEVEVCFGRIRGELNSPRPIDLDLLDYNSRITANNEFPPILPHPRMHLRSFVLLPLAKIAPDWRHPILELTAAELISRLPPGPRAKPID
jgi:2-amino-4-hydroxy-6-hydroxymethyldihydropteridine diphosphokinase